MSKAKGRRKPLHSEITSLRRPAKAGRAVPAAADEPADESTAADEHATADESATASSRQSESVADAPVSDSLTAEDLASDTFLAEEDGGDDASPSSSEKPAVGAARSEALDPGIPAEESAEPAAIEPEAAGSEGSEDGVDREALDEDGSALPETDEDRTHSPSNVISIDGDEPDDMEAFLCGLIEALLFTSQRPLALKEIARAAGIDRPRARELLDRLVRNYAPRGINLDEVAGGYVLRSSPRYAPQLQKFLSLRPVRLSRAQLETLAIVAYRQPVTKPEVDDIRGVDSGQVLKGLLERSLLKILGKKDEPGRPMLYGTTNDFLELLNLRSLGELPTLREYTELSEESRRKFADETGEDAPTELPLDPASSVTDAGDAAAAGVVEAASKAGSEVEPDEQPSALEEPTAMADGEPSALDGEPWALDGEPSTDEEPRAARDEDEEKSDEDEEASDEDEDDEDEDDEDEDEDDEDEDDEDDEDEEASDEDEDEDDEDESDEDEDEDDEDEGEEKA